MHIRFARMLQIIVLLLCKAPVYHVLFLSGRQATLNLHFERGIMRHVFILMRSGDLKEDLKGCRALSVRGLWGRCVSACVCEEK